MAGVKAFSAVDFGYFFGASGCFWQLEVRQKKIETAIWIS